MFCKRSRERHSSAYQRVQLARPRTEGCAGEQDGALGLLHKRLGFLRPARLHTQSSSLASSNLQVNLSPRDHFEKHCLITGFQGHACMDSHTHAAIVTKLRVSAGFWIMTSMIAAAIQKQCPYLLVLDVVGLIHNDHLEGEVLVERCQLSQKVVGSYEAVETAAGKVSVLLAIGDVHMALRDAQPLHQCIHPLLCDTMTLQSVRRITVAQ